MNAGFHSAFQSRHPVQKTIAAAVLVVAGVVLPAAKSWADSMPQVQPAELAGRSCIQAVYQKATSATATCQQAVEAAQQANDQRLEAYALGNLATLELEQQNYQTALETYTQVLELAQTISDPELEVKAWVALGTTYAKLDQNQSALTAFQEALHVAQTHKDQAGSAVATYNLGLIYDRSGQYASAVEAYQQATTLAQQVGDVVLELYAAEKMQMAQQALNAVGLLP